MNENKREYKGNSLVEFFDRYVVVDIETTGLSPYNNEIIEIAAIKVIDDQIVDTFQTLVIPQNPIPKFITQLTGITNDDVHHHGIKPDHAIQQFYDFISDFIMIGHNVHFDINFLYDCSMKYLHQPISNDFVDTQRIAKRLVKDTYNYKLVTLAHYFDIEDKNAHRALNDVFVTNEVYKKLKYLNEHYIEIQTAKIFPNIVFDELLSQKKITIKTQLKTIDETVLKTVLEQLNSKVYFSLLKYTQVLIVNDHTYEELQSPLDFNDPYMMYFNEWKYKAQQRIKEKDLILLSETDVCERLGIKHKKEIDENHPLYGKVCVFTGS